MIRICRGIAHIVTTKSVRLRTMGEGMDLRDVLRLDVDLGVPAQACQTSLAQD